MKDTDVRHSKELIAPLQLIHCELNHTIPYLIAVYHVYFNKSACTFDNGSLLYSYLWIYCWLIFIWCPWYWYTGDPVYSILDSSTPNKRKFIIILMIHVIVMIANMFGSVISNLHRWS